MINSERKDSSTTLTSRIASTDDPTSTSFAKIESSDPPGTSLDSTSANEVDFTAILLDATTKLKVPNVFY